MDPEEAGECSDDENKKEYLRQQELAEELNSRKNEIGKLIEKLNEELKQNISQFHELFELKDRIEIMLKNIGKPFTNSRETQRILKAHRGSEAGRDIVDEALIREVGVFEAEYNILIKERKRINRQLKHLRATRLQIEADIKNKVQVMEIAECLKMLSSLPEIGVTEMKRLPLDSSPTSWIHISETMIQTSQIERNVSQFMSIDVTREMLEAANQCFAIWYSTNAALKKRLQVSFEAKAEIQRHLKKLKQDISTLCANAQEVQNALSGKQLLLQQAQNQLDERKRVPGLELCRDPEMMDLIKEMQFHRNIIEILSPKSKEMEIALNNLNKTKAKLERDLKLKNMAIGDKDRALYYRQSCPISTFQEARSARLFSQ